MEEIKEWLKKLEEEDINTIYDVPNFKKLVIHLAKWIIDFDERRQDVMQIIENADEKFKMDVPIKPADESKIRMVKEGKRVPDPLKGVSFTRKELGRIDYGENERNKFDNLKDFSKEQYMEDGMRVAEYVIEKLNKAGLIDKEKLPLVI